MESTNRRSDGYWSFHNHPQHFELNFTSIFSHGNQKLKLSQSTAFFISVKLFKCDSFRKHGATWVILVAPSFPFLLYPVATLLADSPTSQMSTLAMLMLSGPFWTPSKKKPKVEYPWIARSYLEPKIDRHRSWVAAIRGGCSVVFPGRMSIGQGNEESIVICLKPVNQVMSTKFMKDWLLAEVGISWIRQFLLNFQKFVQFMCYFCLNLTVWSKRMPYRRLSIGWI